MTFLPLTLLLIALAATSAQETGSETRRIEERFLAPCCWRENLAVHRSPDADAIRAELRQLVNAGRTEGEIVAFYIARYGQRILREPQGEPAIWLRTMPVVVSSIGLVFVAWYILRARRRKPGILPATAPVADDEDWL